MLRCLPKNGGYRSCDCFFPRCKHCFWCDIQRSMSGGSESSSNINRSRILLRLPSRSQQALRKTVGKETKYKSYTRFCPDRVGCGVVYILPPSVMFQKNERLPKR